MANVNNPKGFKQFMGDGAAESLKTRTLAATITSSDGDVLCENSAGYLVGYTNNLPIVGVQVGAIIDGLDNAASPKTKAASTGTAGIDKVNFVPCTRRFVAQITSGAVTDNYTTFTVTSAFDVAGSTGVMYINASASTYDDVQIIEPAKEPAGGEPSAYGAYQKVVCMFNPARCAPSL